jgi:hypothetical protein
MDDDAEVDDAQFPLGSAENKKASAGDFDMLKVIGKGSFGKVSCAKGGVLLHMLTTAVVGHSRAAQTRQQAVCHQGVVQGCYSQTGAACCTMLEPAWLNWWVERGQARDE